MKRVGLLSPHFLPSGLVCVHRTRLWSQYLREFDWQPVVFTTDSAYYEPPFDPSLSDTVDDSIDVVQCGALPNWPIRWVGDIGIRSLFYYVNAVVKYHRAQKLDFLLITIPSCFASIAGRLVLRKTGIPYGVDYQDPWVHDTPATRQRWSKAWLSNEMGRHLEPWALAKADLITGVAESYYKPVIQRNPNLARRATLSAIPIGVSARDLMVAEGSRDGATLFTPSDARINVFYAGTIWDQALEALRALMRALRIIIEANPAYAACVRLHFVGTGCEGTVTRIAQQHKLADCIVEHNQRIGHIDVLTHQKHADVCLILGGADAHYVPSKLYQVLASGTGVLAILHARSAACDVLREHPHTCVASFEDDDVETDIKIATQLQRTLVECRSRRTQDLLPGSLYTARDSSRDLAISLNKAVQIEHRHVTQLPATGAGDQSQDIQKNNVSPSPANQLVQGMAHEEQQAPTHETHS